MSMRVMVGVDDSSPQAEVSWLGVKIGSIGTVLHINRVNSRNHDNFNKLKT